MVSEGKEIEVKFRGRNSKKEGVVVRPRFEKWSPVEEERRREVG